MISGNVLENFWLKSSLLLPVTVAMHLPPAIEDWGSHVTLENYKFFSHRFSLRTFLLQPFLMRMENCRLQSRRSSHFQDYQTARDKRLCHWEKRSIRVSEQKEWTKPKFVQQIELTASIVGGHWTEKIESPLFLQYFSSLARKLAPVPFANSHQAHFAFDESSPGNLQVGKRLPQDMKTNIMS